MEAVSSARTRIERSFHPDAIRRMKVEAERDISVGGPQLAREAIPWVVGSKTIQLFLSPVVVGGGTRALPNDVRVDLELLLERRFDNGVVYLRYRAKK